MDLVGMVCMSHSPSWDLSPLDGAPKRYIDAVFRARASIRRAAPDVLVIFGPDHVRNFFFDLMPAFCIGVETVTGFGDFGSPKGALRTLPKLAGYIAEQVQAAGFDPALSYNMGVDHGLSQPVAALTPELATPIVPIMVSSTGAPLPTLARCHAFGEAVGSAIRAFPGSGRAVVVGSGGLSHSPPSSSPTDPDVVGAARDYLINGRTRAEASSREREEASVRRRAAGKTGPINEPWDAWLLECIRQGVLAPILELDNASLLANGGTGGQEIRSWLSALGAWGRPVGSTDYSPVPAWITGMGCAAGFEEEFA